jgi:hypothetical protein
MAGDPQGEDLRQWIAMSNAGSRVWAEELVTAETDHSMKMRMMIVTLQDEVARNEDVQACRSKKPEDEAAKQLRERTIVDFMKTSDDVAAKRSQRSMVLNSILKLAAEVADVLPKHTVMTSTKTSAVAVVKPFRKSTVRNFILR